MDSNDVESIVTRISNEISEVKSLIRQAMNEVSNGNYNSAVAFLENARTLSTCSYCKTKIQKFIYDIGYLSNICGMGYKDCENKKQSMLNEIQGFLEKLPTIEEIKRSKALGVSEQDQPQNMINISYPDIITPMMQALNAPLANVWKMYDSLFKGLFGK